ncbi:MAG: tryptophan-rich sensory protein [archaeon]|nr:MAG: tryptophan-rich sensory protein [archaeon]
MKKEKVFRFIISVAITNAAGFIGSFFTAPNIGSWYATINKPGFTPPNWVFAPAWTTLFVLMGISLYLVWEKGIEKKEVRIGIGVFGVQLFLNILWSLIFFGLQNPFYALLEIIALWLAILATIFLFYRISRKAGYLLAPYIIWVSFAGFLNYSIWILNL